VIAHDSRLVNMAVESSTLYDRRDDNDNDISTDAVILSCGMNFDVRTIIHSVSR